jgi:hypothetical protein
MSNALKQLYSFFEKQQVRRNARLIRGRSRQLFPSIPTVCFFPASRASPLNAAMKLSRPSVAINATGYSQAFYPLFQF